MTSLPAFEPAVNSTGPPDARNILYVPAPAPRCLDAEEQAEFLRTADPRLNTSAMRPVRLLAGLLEAVAGHAADIVSRHPRDCGCKLCRDISANELDFLIEAVRYNSAAACGWLQGFACATSLPPAKLSTHLRLLARLAEVCEADERAGEGHANG